MERGSHGRERRKYPRVAFEGEIAAKIHSVSASPIDLSATGVLLEVTRPLTANAVYTLRLDLSPREQLVLKGRVVRNYVHEFDRSGKGDTLVRYRVAIEFETLAHREQAVIQDFIDRLEKAREERRAEADSADYGGPERRRRSRIETFDDLTGQILLYLEFQMLQLSAGGMMVRLTVPLPVGSMHRFTLSLAGHDLDVAGVVLNCEPLEQGGTSPHYRVGIQFRELDKHHLEFLKQFVVQRLDA